MYRNIVDWLKTWYYGKDYVDEQLDSKQDTLVSGETIKTINDTSLLGAGNIVIEGGSGGGGIYAFGLDFTDIDDPILYIDASSGTSYHLEFMESSYTAIGGTVTVSVLVEENYEPMEGATVSFTSDESTTTTATTDANGVATATITFNDSTTLTASYESASATATITVQSYLFYDACDSTYKSENYGNIIALSTNSQTNYTTYNSTENAYLVKADGDWGLLPIPAMDNQDNYKISAYFKPVSTTTHLYRGGFGFITEGTKYPFYHARLQGNKDFTYARFQSGTEYDRQNTANITITDYHRIEVIKQGNNYTFNLYDFDDTTILVTYSKTFSLTGTIKMGLYLCCGSNYGCYVKEIKAEPL